MYHTRELIVLSVCLGLVCLASAQSRLCPLITINDLGSTANFSIEGLIARGIIPPTESTENIPVRIVNYTIVCDASGDRINTSSYVSVVVELQCNFASALPALTDCDGSTMITRQYQFQCIEQNGQPVWDTIVSGSNQFVQTLDPTATLSTPLANQCRRCIDDQQSSRADPTTHCDSCPSRCDQGLGRCYLGATDDECCNFYFQDICTAACPSPLVNDSNFNCVCPSLSIDNGDVSYSPANRSIGSTATYTCNPGYQLSSPQGGITRTCSMNGWSEQTFTCERVCPFLSIDNGDVSYSPANRGIGSVATYTCNPGYRLSSTANTRACNISGWSGQTFTCELIQCPDLLGDFINDGKVIVTPTARTVNSTAEYFCNDGYKLEKGDAKRTCQNDGTWSGEAPGCTKVPFPIGIIVAIVVAAAVVIALIIGALTVLCCCCYLKSGKEKTQPVKWKELEKKDESDYQSESKMDKPA